MVEQVDRSLSSRAVCRHYVGSHCRRGGTSARTGPKRLCGTNLAEALPVSTEALDLLSKYSDRKILGARFQNDMLHIAIATIAEVDVLVSWNFRHIVRLDKIRLFNAVNIELGYKPLTIYSPREVAPDETNE